MSLSTVFSQTKLPGQVEDQTVVELTYTGLVPSQSIRMLDKDLDTWVLEYMLLWMQTYPQVLKAHPGFEGIVAGIAKIQKNSES